MRRIAAPFFAAILLPLAGCAPVSSPPQLQDSLGPALPATWERASTATAPADTAVDLYWWHSFNDPVLNRLMQDAQRGNLDLRIASARVLEAQALRSGSDADLWPQFDATLDVTRADALERDGNGDGAATSGPRTLAQAGIAASWELDLSGRLRHVAAAAAADEQALQADRTAVQLAVLGEVARNYIEYRLYVAQHALAKKNAEAQQSTVRITQARFREGMASRLDVERAQTLLFNTQATVPQAAEQVEAARARLQLLLATSPQALAELMPYVPAPDPSAPVDTVGQAALAAIPAADAATVMLTPAEVLAQRADVRAAERRLAAAAERLHASGALRYPTLNLAGMIGVASTDVGQLFGSNNGQIWSANAGLLAPLFDFGRIRSQIDADDARQQQAYLAYEQTARGALTDVQTAIVFYTQGVQRQQALADAVTAARKAAELAHRNYAQGTLSLLDVLVAERSQYDSELAWSQATADVALRLVSLWQALGVVPAPLPT